jgi:hypothetical protein
MAVCSNCGSDTAVSAPTYFVCEHCGLTDGAANLAGDAIFVLCCLGDGYIAAVTRPDGSLGLPGGKIEKGEAPLAAAAREAREEGWQFEWLSTLAFHKAKGIVWVEALPGTATMVAPRAEDAVRGIGPVKALAEALTSHGNPEAFEAYRAALRRQVEWEAGLEAARYAGGSEYWIPPSAELVEGMYNERRI